jgi:undecaprenyl diphosphate synthase
MNEKKIQHVAIIMDGNGRWAKERGLPHLHGHREGAEAVQRVVEAANEYGIEYLTLYAFSTENWKRDPEEVGGLMNLLLEFLQTQLETLQKNNIRLKAIGRLKQLPEEVYQLLMRVIDETSKNTAGTLVFALNYGGRAEIADAAARIAEDAKAGKVDVDKIDEKLFSQYLYAPEIPDPDLMIRTSGELRLSNFLLWQLSYSELYVTDIYWPDFGKEDFAEAIDSYYRRNRRYGGRK